jgi:nucleotide-binding universal stress UspA family protein
VLPQADVTGSGDSRHVQARYRDGRRTVATIMTIRPLIIGFDGTPAAERVVREAGALVAPRPAIVVVVWEAGRVFESATTPAFEAPSVTLEIQSALAADEKIYQVAEEMARRGAALAVEVGLAATGLAVAEEASVAETLMRVGRQHDAQAIAVGAHSHRGISELFLGSTARTLVQHAACPVIVVRDGK